MIKAILLDMDGTLIDSETYYIDGTYEWLKRLGFDGLKSDIYPIIGTNMQQTYTILKDLIHSDIATVTKENEKYFLYDHPLNYAELIFKEVKSVLNSLKAEGYKLALCTSSGHKECDTFIKTCGLEGLFDLVLTKQEVFKNKPDPEIYLQALKILEINASEAVTVEDSKNGIIASKKAGLYTLARKDKKFNIDQSDCDQYINDLNDLLIWLRSNNKDG